jgi:hypothetical protein|tara:strand:- start:44 stop:208 length:165 start_codon:yes stop_codon:yes gene_type:complete
MAKNGNRQGLKIMALASAAKGAMKGYKSTKSKEDEKTAALKEKLRQQQEQARRK